MSELGDEGRQENPDFFDRVEELEKSLRPSIEDGFRHGGLEYLKSTLNLLNNEAHAMHSGLSESELGVVSETGRLVGCNVRVLKAIILVLGALNVYAIRERDVRFRHNLRFIEQAIQIIGNAKALLVAKKEGLCPILIETPE